MPNMNAQSRTVRKLWPMGKGYSEGHTLKIYGNVRKALSQGTNMPNMNALFLRTKKL